MRHQEAPAGTTNEIVIAAHCAGVDVRARKPEQLFSVKRVRIEKKLRIIGRCGINDVMRSAPLEAVSGSGFKPDGEPHSVVAHPD